MIIYKYFIRTCSKLIAGKHEAMHYTTVLAINFYRRHVGGIRDTNVFCVVHDLGNAVFHITLKYFYCLSIIDFACGLVKYFSRCYLAVGQLEYPIALEFIQSVIIHTLCF